MWTINVKSDVVQGEWREDSYRFYEVFCVTAHNENGTRFVHTHTFTDDRKGAEKLAERVNLADFKGSFSPENNQYWREIQPVWGSPEYSRQGGDWVFHGDLEPELNPYLTESEKDRVAWERDLLAC